VGKRKERKKKVVQRKFTKIINYGSSIKREVKRVWVTNLLANKKNYPKKRTKKRKEKKKVPK